MKSSRWFVLAAALVTVLGCGGGGGQATGRGGSGGGLGGAGGLAGAAGAQGIGGGGGSTGGQGGGVITLVGWVDDLAEQHTNATDPPDTVEDKVGVIVDTDDPAAFDPLLSKQAP